MPFNPSAIRSVAFDLGNTLIPFGHEAVEVMNARLAETLERHFGHVDRGALDDIRAADRMQPYERGHRENHIPTLCQNMVRSVYGVEASQEVLDDLVQARWDGFLSVISLPEGYAEAIAGLRERYVLGVLSNYPDGDAVRESLDIVGISQYFETVVASGDVGFCKPDPRPFALLSSRLGVEPSETLYVGDNWLADVQGAKRFGMYAALVTRFELLEIFEPEEGDFQPDMVVTDIVGLASQLL